VLTALSAMTIAFVGLLFHTRDSLADERLEVVASLVLVVAAGGALIVIGGIEGAVAIEFGRKHKRESVGYLLLSLISLSSGIYLGVSQYATLQVVALVASLHGFTFGLAQLRMAQHLSHHPAYKRVFVFNGVVEILLGVALVIGSRLPNEETATLLGYVGILSVLQVLPLVLYPNTTGNQLNRAGQL
jgi:hypothetical protein